MSPKNQDAFYVLVPVPNNLSGINWSVEGEKVKDLINLQKNEEALAVHAYEQWGFKDITKEKLKILRQINNKPNVIKIKEADLLGVSLVNKAHINPNTLASK